VHTVGAHVEAVVVRGEANPARCGSHALAPAQRSRWGRCRLLRTVSHERPLQVRAAFRAIAPRFERARTRRRRSAGDSGASVGARSGTYRERHAACSWRALTDESIKFPFHQLRGLKRRGSAAAAKSAPSTREVRLRAWGAFRVRGHGSDAPRKSAVDRPRSALGNARYRLLRLSANCERGAKQPFAAREREAPLGRKEAPSAEPASSCGRLSSD
jgi:hypothetical protein